MEHESLDSSACQLQCNTLTEVVRFWVALVGLPMVFLLANTALPQSGPSSSPPLAELSPPRAAASRWRPKSFGPEADPLLNPPTMHSSRIASPTQPRQKHDQQR